MAGRPDIVLVSVGTTFGLRRADAAFAEHARAAGASCEVRTMSLGASARLRRRMSATDVVEALGARRAARGAQAGAFVYSSVTAALLQPPRAPVAIRFDGIAAVNRPGAGGAWQRRRERPLLRSAALLLPWSDRAADAARATAGARVAPIAVLPPPVASVRAATGASFDAVAYAANPVKRGLGLLCEAWADAAPAGARLGVGGLDAGVARRRLGAAGVPEPAGVEWLGALAPERWLETVAGARTFLSAARFEDWGMAQMEALAAGVPLVCAPAPGAYAALPLARALAPALVATERSRPALARALRAGLALSQAERDEYAEAARRALEPYAERELKRRMAEEILPRLLSSSS